MTGSDAPAPQALLAETVRTIVREEMTMAAPHGFMPDAVADRVADRVGDLVRRDGVDPTCEAVRDWLEANGRTRDWGNATATRSITVPGSKNRWRATGSDA